MGTLKHTVGGYKSKSVMISLTFYILSLKDKQVWRSQTAKHLGKIWWHIKNNILKVQYILANLTIDAILYILPVCVGLSGGPMQIIPDFTQR